MEFLLAYRTVTYGIPVEVEAFDIESNLVGSNSSEEIVTGDPVIIGLNPNMAFKSFTHICRIKGCGGAGWPPPPIILERLKLPQQIIYRRKENLSESPNHQKYWENILVSRFYEQFSRNRRNLGHFRKFKKISNS